MYEFTIISSTTFNSQNEERIHQIVFTNFYNIYIRVCVRDYFWYISVFSFKFCIERVASRKLYHSVGANSNVVYYGGLYERTFQRVVILFFSCLILIVNIFEDYVPIFIYIC